jgi:hypothetical protein
MANTGPDAFFASLSEKTSASAVNGKTTLNDSGPEAFFSQLSLQLQHQPQNHEFGCKHHIDVGCDCHHKNQHHHHNNDDTSSDEESDSNSGKEGDDLDYTINTIDDATMAAIAQQFPQLKIDMSIPMEGGLWRKFKKGVSAGVKGFRSAGKEHRAKKAERDADHEAAKADRAAKKKAAESSTDDKGTASLASSTATLNKTLSTLVSKTQLSSSSSSSKLSSSDPTPLGASSPSIKADPSSTLSIGAGELVKTIASLVQRGDINTALPELGSAVLNAKDIPNAHYANLAIASMLATLRLAVETRLSKNSLDMSKFVFQSRANSGQASGGGVSLDNTTFEHLRNVIAVFAGEMNVLCTRLGDEDRVNKAIEQGKAMGQTLISKLDKTYVLDQKTVLSESHPIVRLGAILTSLLSITVAHVTGQRSLNASVHANMKPIWASPLTQATFHSVIRDHFE